MTIQYFKIGTTYGGMVNVETLSTTPNMAPAAFYREYSEAVPVGDGGAFGRGSVAIEWRWDGFIPSDMFDALRAICPGASADVYIHSRTERGDPVDDDDYTDYTAKMIWPELTSYEYRSGVYRSFVLRFTKVATYTP